MVFQLCVNCNKRFSHFKVKYRLKRDKKGLTRSKNRRVRIRKETINRSKNVLSPFIFRKCFIEKNSEKTFIFDPSKTL